MTSHIPTSEFDERVKKRLKRSYIGGYDNSIGTSYIANLVSRKGPKLTMVRKFTSRRHNNSVIFSLNVEDDVNVDCVTQKGFWPRGNICRPWVSRAAMHRQHIPESPERHENKRLNSYVYSTYTHDRYDDYRGTLSYNRYYAQWRGWLTFTSKYI